MLDNDHPGVETQSAGLKNVFIGRQGLRAGWRLLLFLILLAVLFTAGAPLQRRFVHNLGSDFSVSNVLVGELFAFAVLLIATLIMGRFEHRDLADYGLPFRYMLRKNFWVGALWGFVMLSFVVALMAASGAYSPGGLALKPMQIVTYGFLWAVAFLMVGFFEEFTFRGYMQYTLTTGMGFWPAAGLTCVIFALAHRGNPGETWVGLVEIVLIAAFLCVALRRTGNLWFAIGWHMAFDWGESFFYSTPNSGMQATGHMLNATMHGSKWLTGGTVGPEATIADVIVTALGILFLAKVYPQAKYPVTPVPAPQLETTETSDPMNLPA